VSSVSLRHLLIGTCLLALVGCQPPDEISKYTVEQRGREKLRTLGAIVPVKGDYWFVKLTGPEAAVSAEKPNFDLLLASLKIDDKKNPPLRWERPDTWKRAKAGGMRQAAFLLPAKDTVLETTIIKLDREGNSVLENINRWRDFLTLPPVERAQLDETIERRKINDTEVIVFDKSGLGVYIKPLTRPVQVPFLYEIPADWAPSNQQVAFSEDTYEVMKSKVDKDGKVVELEATVTVTPAGGSKLENLNRWRGQLKLPELSQAEMDLQTRKIDVLGVKADYVDFANPQLAKGRNRFLGVLLPYEKQTWVLKMAGPDELVGEQKQAFETFVKSIKLDAR
jgi:hypothetical protein